MQSSFPFTIREWAYIYSRNCSPCRLRASSQALRRISYTSSGLDIVAEKDVGVGWIVAADVDISDANHTVAHTLLEIDILDADQFKILHVSGNQPRGDFQSLRSDRVIQQGRGKGALSKEHAHRAHPPHLPWWSRASRPL